MITKDYIHFLRHHFALDWRGIHGAPHWARVRNNGLLLAKSTGADAQVVEVFAFIHDAERRNDGSDPEHGRRAAILAADINDEFFKLSPPQMYLLMDACEGHSLGGRQADVTVQTCWDADRLDLGRIGIKPLAEKLCTQAAKNPEVIEWAYGQSLG